MIATTWVQIVKAVLLLVGAAMLALLALSRFNFNPLTLFDAAASQYGGAVLGPGRLVSDPFDAISLGLALMLGTAGLPHILMRFYTVPDAKTARTSVAYATAFIGFFYLLTFILGFGAMVIVGQPAIRGIDAGGNMAAPLLAEAVGGQSFLGFISAVAFATILAVVAGLTLAGAAALSIFWRRFTTRAAQASMLIGTASSLLLIYLSPTIQIDILKNDAALFPLRTPGIISIPLSFLVAVGVSLLQPEPAAAAGFVEVEKRVHFGIDKAKP